MTTYGTAYNHTSQSADYIARTNRERDAQDIEFGIRPLHPYDTDGHQSLNSQINLPRVYGGGVEGAIINSNIERNFIKKHITNQMTKTSDARQVRWNISETNYPPLWEPWLAERGMGEVEFKEIMANLRTMIKEGKKEECLQECIVPPIVIFTFCIAAPFFWFWNPHKKNEKDLIAHLESINVRLNPRGLGIVYEKIGNETRFLYIR
jgi:hypothetical protein